MHRRAFLAGAAALPLAGCIEQAGYNYRLGVRVEVGGQEYSGESVCGFQYTHAIGAYEAKRAMIGEAVTIDLGPRRGLLFVLMTSRYMDAGMFPQMALTQTVDSLRAGNESSTDRVRRVGEGREPAKIKVNEMPVCVRFQNINDFRSVEQVDLANMSKTYNTDARFIEAKIAVVDAPLTDHMKRLAPKLREWAIANPKQSLAGTMLRDKEADLPGRICGQDFARDTLISGDPYKEPSRQAREREAIAEEQKDFDRDVAEPNDTPK